MATITELKARREALSASRATGAARVSYDGRSVEYRSLAETDRAIEALDRENRRRRGPARRPAGPHHCQQGSLTPWDCSTACAASCRAARSALVSKARWPAAASAGDLKKKGARAPFLHQLREIPV